MLSSRQRSFCEQYLQTENAEESAKAAGYRNPGQGRRLVESAALWLDWSREQYHCQVAGRQEILEFYTALMRGQSEDGAELKLSERLKGAEALSRILGLFGAPDERPEPVRIVDDCEVSGADD